MGTPGVAMNIKKESIVEAIKKHRGKMIHIGRELNIGHTKAYDLIWNDPELKQLVDDQREIMVEGVLDTAEYVLEALMVNAKEDPGNAIKSAMFYLNNQGKKRKYAHPAEEVKSAVNDIRHAIQQASKESIEGFERRRMVQGPVQPVLEIESPILDKEQGREEGQV